MDEYELSRTLDLLRYWTRLEEREKNYQKALNIQRAINRMLYRSIVYKMEKRKQKQNRWKFKMDWKVLLQRHKRLKRSGA